MFFKSGIAAFLGADWLTSDIHIFELFPQTFRRAHFRRFCQHGFVEILLDRFSVNVDGKLPFRIVHFGENEFIEQNKTVLLPPIGRAKNYFKRLFSGQLALAGRQAKRRVSQRVVLIKGRRVEVFALKSAAHPLI